MGVIGFLFGDEAFPTLLGAARNAVHHTRHHDDAGPGPVPNLGNPEHSRRASYMEARVPTSFKMDVDGRGRTFMQGYDQYGNPI